jgi:hypothetical protein
MKHLSATSLATYLECPAKWRQKKIVGLSEPTTGPLVVGTALHAAMEQTLRRRLEGRPDCDADRLIQAFDESIDRSERSARIKWGRDGRDQAIHHGHESTLAIFDWTRDIQPIAVEWPFSVPLLGGEPDDDGVPTPVEWTFDGRIDIVTLDGIGDLKSTATAESWSQGRARMERQPGAYDLCRVQDFPQVAPKLFFPVVAKDTYGVKTYPVRLTEQRRNSIKTVAMVAAKLIDRGYFPRGENCRWCPLKKQGGC